MTNYVDVFGNSTTPPSEYGYAAITLSANTTAYWPYNYTGTGTVLAKSNSVSATAGSLALTLPAATEVSTGEDLTIKNSGSNSFDVKDNAGNTLTTIAAGVVKYFILTTNTTAAGTWDVTTFGTGTSTADASTLAGNGHRVDGARLENVVTNSSIGSGYTISTTDNATTLVYKSGTATLALPDPGLMFNGFHFLFVNEGSGTVTFDPASTATIDGSTTKDIQPGESCIVTCDSSYYYTVGYGRSNTYTWTQLSVDLTGLSSYTVTSTQAANKLWYFFNSPTTSITVTIPAVASVYFLRVGAVGVYSLTFTTGSGATVSLTANQSYIIYCDGTNVTAAQTVAIASTVTLDDGSAAAPSLYFTLDPNTGLYRPTTDQLGIATGGVSAGYFTSSGFNGNVVGNVTGNVVGDVAGNATTATTATTATNATNATHLTGGATGTIVYQSATGATTYLTPGANGYVLTSAGAGAAPVWTVGVPSGEAGNLTGGSAGALPYQSGVSTTLFSGVGISGQVLVSGGTGAPTWYSLTGLVKSTAGVLGSAVSGTDVKTINGVSILGSGDVPIVGAGLYMALSFGAF